VHLHLLDIGGALSPLAALPHVRGIAGADQPELAARIVDELACGPNRPTVLVVDDWAQLRQQLPDVEDELGRIALGARSLGVHLLVAARRWGDLRPAVRDGFDTRIELRLGDPLDSELDRRLAAAVPRRRPGRGIADGGHFLAALPRLHRDSTEDDEALSELVSRVATHWHGPRPRRLQGLPSRVRLDELPDADRVRLGVGGAEGALRTLPAWGHLVVLGDAGSGRTTLLRTILQEVVRTRPGDRFLVVDPRRCLVGAVPGRQLLAHVDDDPTAEVEALAARLAHRLRQRTAPVPATWLVVDDLDLLPPTPWEPLARLLPRSADVGLRLVIARRAGGAARAYYEPLLATLRELRAPAVLLSGSPAEGPLVNGVPARPAPPGRARWVGPAGDEGAFQVAEASDGLDRSKVLKSPNLLDIERSDTEP
jgi:S-DNA-T family DNA segregation ATPase FtsK/SpoIIIE